MFYKILNQIIFITTTFCLFISTTLAQININTADQAELQTLKGVGEVKAKNIIEYRNKNGNFESVEDLKNVPGFGEKSVNKLKDQIVVDVVKQPDSSDKNANKNTANNSKNTVDATKKVEKNKTDEAINNNAISTKK